ncbi:signal peptidase I [Sphingomonas sp. ABOLD]|uniref:Signal peptidase I n=1 Tax=Sphingomonas trueperi TaxID=53317 RepID=A0A7X5Y149_9SPHN|nr:MULTISPECIES: signal peptidase I [Sphingomonas]NJB98680.1 signal peptidase I [Sphingomonas trueperi]RSV45851.1 signal peptidase I [Sphingomonas sp. ABOLD]
MAEPKPGWKRTLAGWAATLGIFFLFQSAVARPYYIPSGSMMPALRTGDRLVATKFPYGFSQASLMVHGKGISPVRLFGGTPARGDIVIVVRRGDGEDLIKRVIGLPGDTVAVRHGVVILNGKPVPRVAEGRARIPVDAAVPCDEGPIAAFRTREADGKLYCEPPLYRETLPNGASYNVLDLGDTMLPNGFLSPGDNYGPITVPAGHVFLMGDNRDQSADSRFGSDELGLGGPVPLETIAGRAELVTHSFDGEGSWFNPLAYVTAIRWDRSFTSLRPKRAD